MKKLVFALHGFLGEQGDWDFLRKEPIAGWHLLVPDYTRIPGISPSSGGIETWGAQFIGWKRSVYGDKPFSLIGYSQGGRLALTALAEQAPECRGGVIISANPGILEKDRESRKQSDINWAKRFSEEKLEVVIQDWNSQGVFAGTTKVPDRNIENLERHILSDCLTNWSLGRQPDLKSWVQTTDLPLCWVTGKLDEKYNLISADLKLKSKDSRRSIIPESGHRVLFDQSQKLRSEIVSFLAAVDSKS